MILHSFVVAALCATATNAFSPLASSPLSSLGRLATNDALLLPSSSVRPQRCPSSLLFAVERESVLRQEIADRNTNKENEDRYVVADGENMENLGDAPSEMSEQAQAKWASQLKRLTKPRAYPLFLMEKAAEVVETTLEDLSKALNGGQVSSVPPVDKKERIVILGTGWGAASLVQVLDPAIYDITVVSPRNYFVFTPMLAGSSVGTYEYRSITQPIREINPKAKYLEATATDIDMEKQLVFCESVVCDGNSCDIEQFEVPYDRVVVTVGAQTNTFGIPGVREYCNFLKQVEDARRIRTAIVNCFERANLPSMTEEERVSNLTFAVVGAGPTGIEFAAELRDFVEQDGPKYYPQLLKYVRIKVIEASNTVLAPFDKSLQDEAIKSMNAAPRIKDPEVLNLLPERFKLTELLLDSSVKEVTDKEIRLNDGSNIPYGLVVWAAGNGPIPLTLNVIDALGEEQAKEQSTARGRIAIDPWMRAVGGKGRVLAFGDCSCLTSTAPLPATAQVASQQGEYLASLMNRRYNLSPSETTASDGSPLLMPPMRDPQNTKSSMSDYVAGFAMNNYDYAKPFQFLNLGILAYTGDSTALAQVTPVPGADPVKSTGQVGNFLWRGVYWYKQVSWRNRLLVVNDWAKRAWFGRDITRV